MTDDLLVDPWPMRRAEAAEPVTDHIECDDCGDYAVITDDKTEDDHVAEGWVFGGPDGLDYCSECTVKHGIFGSDIGWDRDR